MLVALIAYLTLAGGGATGPMLYINAAAEKIEVVVVDEARQEQALLTIESMLGRGKQNNKALDGLRGQLAEAVSRRDVVGHEIDAIWDEYFELDAQYSHEIIELRFQLRDQLTREEWAAVFSGDGAGASKP